MKYPKAVGPYSPYYKAWNTLYCSGQIWLIPDNMEIIEWWVENETKQVISNIYWVLTENWLEFSNVVKTTIYLANMWDFAKVNKIYAESFSHKPARSTIAVKELPLWALVEIEVLAIFE
jgi:2-iminobutanoate/2-iminopropanoate deaminase